MDNVILSILSLFVGVLATIFVSRYYFQRSVKKSLTPFVDFSSDLLTGIDPEVRASLEIKYQGLPVDDLFQIQILVANTGERSIRDLIEPLKLNVPENSKLMDASILHIYPEGRAIDLRVSDNKESITYKFSLLNKDEFFITKLLLSGNPEPEDFKFSISVDDLPPTLEVCHLPYDDIEVESEKKKKNFDIGQVSIGLFFITVSYGVINLASSVGFNFPTFSLENIIPILRSLDFLKFSVLSGLVIGVAIGLVGIAITISSFENVRIFKKKKFVVPQGITTRHRFNFHQPELEELEEKFNKLTHEMQANKPINRTNKIGGQVLTK